MVIRSHKGRNHMLAKERDGVGTVDDRRRATELVGFGPSRIAGIRCSSISRRMSITHCSARSARFLACVRSASRRRTLSSFSRPGLSFGTAKGEDLSRPAEAPAIPGDIIPERWATSSRNGGRHYLGMGGRHHSGIMGGLLRNPHNWPTQHLRPKLATACLRPRRGSFQSSAMSIKSSDRP